MSDLNVNLANTLGINKQGTYIEKENIKDVALDKAKSVISAFEEENEEFDDAGGFSSVNKKIDLCELKNANLDDLAQALEEFDLDGKDGLNDKEVASYLMAIDGLELKDDEKYAKWEFVDNAKLDENDLKKGVFNKEKIDGNIDKDSLVALDKISNEELKQAASEIYSENFKKKPWYERIANTFQRMADS